jgi:hypothetical protein
MKTTIALWVAGFIVGAAIAEIFLQSQLLTDMSVVLRDQHRMITAAVRREYAHYAAAKENTPDA